MILPLLNWTGIVIKDLLLFSLLAKLRWHGQCSQNYSLGLDLQGEICESKGLSSWAIAHVGDHKRKILFAP